ARGLARGGTDQKRKARPRVPPQDAPHDFGAEKARGAGQKDVVPHANGPHDRTRGRVCGHRQNCTLVRGGPASRTTMRPSRSSIETGKVVEGSSSHCASLHPASTRTRDG